MKKEWIKLIFFIVIIFSIMNVSAACVANQRIMRISDDTNAHGEVYNGADGYSVEICYDEIFGINYPIEEGAYHDCILDPSNKVLGLSASTNAHAQVPSMSDYGNVCYGDLECSSTTGACSSFGSKYQCVVTLSGNTNAHLAECDSVQAYNTKICCKSQQAGYALLEINPFWSDDGTSHITSPVNKGDSVYMVAEFSETLDSTEVTFEIWRDDTYSGDNKINTTTATVTGDRYSVFWSAGEEGTYDSREYYFKVIKGLRTNSSENLKVIGNEKSLEWINGTTRAEISNLDVEPEVTSISMILRNANLTYNIDDPVSFEIYEVAGIDEGIRTGEEAIVGYVGADGDAVADWTISYIDLKKLGELKDTYKFKFEVDGDLSPRLDVAIIEPAECSTQILCSDYLTQSSCEADNCGVADTSVENKPFIEEGFCDLGNINCFCAWDDAEGCSGQFEAFVPSPNCGNNDLDEKEEECDRGDKNGEECSGCSSNCEYVAIDPDECGGCPEGLELCSDGTCSLNCEDTDKGIFCNKNGTCDTGEGCSCSDCNGKSDTCVTGLVCSLVDRGCCKPVADETCENYCSFVDADCPGPTCGNGDKEHEEYCDLGDKNGEECSGCSSNCEYVAIDPDECGGCPEGTSLCEDGTCSMNCYYTNNGTACDYDKVCETGEGCLCSDCDGKQDRCLDGLLCNIESRSCCNPVADFVCDRRCAFIDPDCRGDLSSLGALLGTCKFLENSSDDCNDGFLTYSWSSNITWAVGNEGVEGSNPDGNDYVFFDSSIDPSFDDKWHYDPINSRTNKRAIFESCRSGANTIECPSKVQLSFFGVYNLIISSILIGLIYVFLIKKRE